MNHINRFQIIFCIRSPIGLYDFRFNPRVTRISIQKKWAKDIVKRYNIKFSVQNRNMAQIWISSSSKHPGFSNSMYAARLFLKRRAA